MAQTASEPIATAAMLHLKKSSGLMFAGAGIWGDCQRSQKAGETWWGFRSCSETYLSPSVSRHEAANCHRSAF
jgi:hypothetical protein